MPKPEEMNHTVGEDNVQKFGLDMHNPVFFISAGVILIFTILGAVAPEMTGEMFSQIKTFFEVQLDWFLLTAANLFVLFAIIVMISPLGKIRLGGADARPDFGYLGWFSMLFAAGMGIGLMFFGVLEPMYHASGMFGQQPLNIAGYQGDGSWAGGEITEQGREIGMAATIFHWGLHPWAVYATLALALAFFAFNHGMPLSLRSAFFPLIGNYCWRWPGHVIDVLAVFATMFGLCTSLGFGAGQAAQGLNIVFGYPEGLPWQILLICLITGAALISVWRGLKGGVQKLSELNLILMVLLLVFVIIAGPTLAVVTGVFQTTWDYITNVVALSNPIGREDDGFRHAWTTFYWAWWISWSPFVGMFIARVSRGRTVREFIFCVLVVPTVASIIWMQGMGGSAIHAYMTEGVTDVFAATFGPERGAYNDTTALFAYLESYPLSLLTQTIGVILTIVFFVTSSDSGSLVIDTITSGGKTDATTAQKAFWVLFEGLVAIVLLSAGGLSALQAASVMTGTPFGLLLLIMCVSLFIGLKNEDPNAKGPEAGFVVVD